MEMFHYWIKVMSEEDFVRLCSDSSAFWRQVEAKYFLSFAMNVSSSIGTCAQIGFNSVRALAVVCNEMDLHQNKKEIKQEWACCSEKTSADAVVGYHRFSQTRNHFMC